MKKRTLLLTVLTIIVTGCATKMKIKGSAENNLKPLQNTQSVVIIEENESFEINNSNIKIGTFEIKDGGLSLDCSYERVKNLARQKARSLGGNSVKIVEHKLPNAWSTCHRIKFDIYKLVNISEFEKELIWSTSNKLKWKYFKGAPKIDKLSHFCGYIDVQFNNANFLNGKGIVNITPIFLFDCSYVQPLKKDKFLLEYNQVKFDLIEIYSRKMREEFQKSKIDTQEKWTKFAQTIFDKVYNEYNTDIFNLESETNFGENYSALSSWKFKTENNLKKLIEFSTEKN